VKQVLSFTCVATTTKERILTKQQGRGSEAPTAGSHSNCFNLSVPIAPVRVERGPLAALEKRLLGSAAGWPDNAATEKRIRRAQLVVHAENLRNERLWWFIRAAGTLSLLALLVQKYEC